MTGNCRRTKLTKNCKVSAPEAISGSAGSRSISDCALVELEHTDTKDHRRCAPFVTLARISLLKLNNLGRHVLRPDLQPTSLVSQPADLKADRSATQPVRSRTHRRRRTPRRAYGRGERERWGGHEGLHSRHRPGVWPTLANRARPWSPATTAGSAERTARQQRLTAHRRVRLSLPF